jgi:hypothetical protein
VRRIVVLAVGLALVAGCGGKKPPAGIGQDSNRTKAHVVVKVRGDQTIDFDKQTTIIIYRTLDKRVPLGLRLFSVGMPPPHVAFTDGASFRAAFDVLSFTGDGDYTIPKTIVGSPVPGPSGLPLPSGIQSSAFVEVLRPTADPPITRYDVALEPCRVKTAHESLTGSVSCPHLKSDRDASTLSLEMTWDAR